MSTTRPSRIRMLWKASMGFASAWAYFGYVRPKLRRWGATDAEVAAAMPGDDEVRQPILAVTRAVTIDAPPSAVWPWIVQVGYHRAGWYAYDLFDNDDIPSAESILPEFQHLEVSQVIGEEGNAVREIAAEQHLLLGFAHPKVEWVFKQGIWPKFGTETLCFQLKAIEDGRRTRLLYRVRVTAPALAVPLLIGFFEPADFVASRKMLTGIKRRAETASARVGLNQP
jgi:hypothetical protein